MIHTGPCTTDARYRNFALLRTDYESYLEVRKSEFDDTKLILSVGGQIRTVVDGPMQYGILKKGVAEDLTIINITKEGQMYVNVYSTFVE